MFEFTELTRDNIIALKAYGKIEKKDYEKLIPVIEKTEREGKPIRLFIRIGDIKGITGEALLKDITTYFEHVKNIEKVAIVGEGKYHEKTWVRLADPFMKAEIKYFPVKETVNASDWIEN